MGIPPLFRFIPQWHNELAPLCIYRYRFSCTGSYHGYCPDTRSDYPGGQFIYLETGGGWQAVVVTGGSFIATRLGLFLSSKTWQNGGSNAGSQHSIIIGTEIRITILSQERLLKVCLCFLVRAAVVFSIVIQQMLLAMARLHMQVL